MIANSTASNLLTPNRIFSYWFFAAALMVLLIVLVGGVTRLTGSGLSIVEWRPVTGILFPLNQESWLNEFAKYQQSPEFKLVNFMLSLDEFKFIYFLEYFHRLLARLLGFVFLIPLIYFAYNKILNLKILKISLVAIALASLQAIIGWYMVKSGLNHNPHVSHYRLALHLITATALFAFLLWHSFSYNSKLPVIAYSKTFYLLSLSFVSVTFLQIFSGALVAGLQAGLIYNNFPLMGDSLLPPDLLSLKPLARNFVDNPPAVQLFHRLLGSITFLLGFIISIYINKVNNLRSLKSSGNILFFLLTLQLILGIGTLKYSVPIFLAGWHQVNALMVLGVGVYILFISRGADKAREE